MSNYRPKSELLRRKTGAYAEGQNSVQHTDHPSGLMKVLKSDPFAEEEELFGSKEADPPSKT